MKKISGEKNGEKLFWYLISDHSILKYISLVYFYVMFVWMKNFDAILDTLLCTMYRV